MARQCALLTEMSWLQLLRKDCLIEVKLGTKLARGLHEREACVRLRP